MGKKNKIMNFGTLPIMIILTCVSQVLVLVKSSILASSFGASMEMDAFSLANSIVVFIFGILASGVPTIILPHYINKTDHKSINTFITYIYLLIFVLIIFVLFSKNTIISLLSGRPEEFTILSGEILSILIVGQFVVSVTNVTISFFQSRGKYNLPRVTAIFSNTLLILVLLFRNDLTIYQYAICFSGSLMLNFFIDMVLAYKEGWKFKPTIQIDPQVKNMLKTFTPIIFSSGVYQISLFIDSAIVSRLETGQLTILSYSSQITNMVYSIIIANLLTFSYPQIVKSIQHEKNQVYFWKITSTFHLFVCLIVAGFIVVGKEGVSVFLGHGKFSDDAVSRVYIGTSIYIIGQQISIVRELIYRYFYSIGNTKIAAVNSVIVSISNIIISLILVHFIGYYGIIIGTVLAATISLTIVLFQYRRKIGFFSEGRQILFRLTKNLIICSITIFIVLMIKNNVIIHNQLLAIISFGSMTLLVFAFLSWALQRNIKDDILLTLKKK